MAEKKAKKGEKNYCSASGHSGINYDKKTATLNITMDYFPLDEKLRAKWTRFCAHSSEKFRPEKVLMFVFGSFLCMSRWKKMPYVTVNTGWKRSCVVPP